MKEQDYPGLYRSADGAAAEAQSALLRQYKANSVLLVLAAAIALVSDVGVCIAIIGLMLFLASLGFYIYGRFNNLQDKWYQARALAESVKTTTWRFMMNAEPFNSSVKSENLEKFRALLRELLKQNEKMADMLSGDGADGDQLTSEMLRVVQAPLLDKKAFYKEERIKDQRNWYRKKAQYNKTQSRYYFFGVCAAYGGAIILLAVRIASPDANYLPIDLFAVIASSIIGWSQLKRFDELASAYAFTAHEVGIIESKFNDVASEADLSAFVADAENAFSREHTQWAARRDHE